MDKDKKDFNDTKPSRILLRPVLTAEATTEDGEKYLVHLCFGDKISDD